MFLFHSSKGEGCNHSFSLFGSDVYIYNTRPYYKLFLMSVTTFGLNKVGAIKIKKPFFSKISSIL